MAILAHAMEALDRELDACGDRGERVGVTPRAVRIVLFDRNELWDCRLAELRQFEEPLTARRLAVLVCQMKGKDGRIGACCRT